MRKLLLIVVGILIGLLALLLIFRGSTEKHAHEPAVNLFTSWWYNR